jgi:hypothetical protein
VLFPDLPTLQVDGRPPGHDEHARDDACLDRIYHKKDEEGYKEVADYMASGNSVVASGLLEVPGAVGQSREYQNGEPDRHEHEDSEAVHPFPFAENRLESILVSVNASENIYNEVDAERRGSEAHCNDCVGLGEIPVGNGNYGRDYEGINI